MTTIADMIDEALGGGTQRSREYRRGVEDVLKLKFGGQPIRVPFKLGTPEFDAYFAGNERGHELCRVELQRRQDAEALARERIFFADADAL